MKILDYILFVCFIIYFHANTKAQTIEHNLEKYWYYRDKLKKEFVVIGNPDLPGTNIPASWRQLMKDSDGDRYKILQWGDATISLSVYIQVLTTEYRLLKDYGQDYSQTLQELFYALKTLERLDLNAEKHLRKTGEIDYENDLNGFFLRDDVQGPCTHNNWICREQRNNYNYNILDYNGGQLRSDVGFDNTGVEVENVGSDYMNKNSPSFDKDAVSQDQTIHLLLSLAMVVKLVDENTLFEDTEGEQVSLKFMAQKNTKRLITAFHGCYYLNMPGFIHSKCTWWQALTGNCFDCDNNLCPYRKWLVGICGHEYDCIMGWNINSPVFGEESIMEGDCYNPLSVKDGASADGPFSYGMATAGNVITEEQFGSLHYANSLYFKDSFASNFPEVFSYWINTQTKRYVLTMYMILLTVNPTSDFFNFLFNPHDILSTFEFVGLFFEYQNLLLSFQILNYDETRELYFNKSKLLMEQLLNLAPDCGIYNLNGNCPNSSWDKVNKFNDNSEGCDATWESAGFYNGMDYMLLHNLYWLRYIDMQRNSNVITDFPTSHHDYGTHGSHSKPVVISGKRLTADNTINSDGKATYIAKDEIILKPGFETKDGAEFDAYCSENTVYKYINYNPGCDFSSMVNKSNVNWVKSKKQKEYENKETEKTENCECGADNKERGQINNSQITIYPNPVKGSFNVFIKKYQFNNSYIYYIYDIQGNVVLSNKLTNQHTNIDLYSLNQGVYIVKILSDTGVFLEKIIVQK